MGDYNILWSNYAFGNDILKYRPEIDGLRALAVIPVILFHVGLGWFSGGFLGVDVFFVISGYLIATIIIDEIAEDKFSIVKFYERRARRILPALSLTVILTLSLTPFFLIPSQLKDVGQSVFATALFASNYFFYLETDYFNQFSSNTPLLHTWSLAVEEQFYIIFPIIAILLKGRIRHIFIIALVIFFVSLFLANETSLSNRPLAFYSLHTRAWEIMVGVLVAFIFKKYFTGNNASLHVGNSALTNLISGVSFCVLIATFILFDSKIIHPSYYTLIPVFATAALILYTKNGGVVTRILSFKPIVNIGLLSYGLYLFHYPIFALIDIYYDYLAETRAVIKIAILPFVFLISYISLRFIENPIRNRNKFSRNVVFGFSVALLIIFASTGLILHKKNGFQSYFSNKYAAAGMPLLVNVEVENELVNSLRSSNYPSDDLFNCADDCKKILVIGDSVAEDLYLSIASNSDVEGLDVRLVRFDDECMGSIKSVVDLSSESSCDKRFGSGIRFQELISEASHIIISAKWQESTYQDGYRFSKIIDGNYDSKVYLVGSVLFTDLSSFSIKMWKNEYEFDDLAKILYDHQRWDRRVISNKLRSMVADDKSLLWIEKSDFFCNELKKECSLFYSIDEPKIWDNTHLTTRSYNDYSHFILMHII